MALSDDDVREILRLIDESGLDELKLETEGLSLHVRRGGGPPIEEPAPAAPVATPAPAPAPAPTAAEAAPAAPAASNGHAEIKAPMLGTFYRQEAPGKAPFVEVGSTVEAGTVVCVIEVMKMMNSIEAGISGTIVEICADNATLVEYGQPLFRVAP
jgi:acetyl-CoA carboxylase biotin carboxyl carrier protein